MLSLMRMLDPTYDTNLFEQFAPLHYPRDNDWSWKKDGKDDVLRISTPGVPKKELDVRLSGDKLTVKAGDRRLYRFTVKGTPTASYEDGVLSLRFSPEPEVSIQID